VRVPGTTATGATLLVALSVFACGRPEPVSSQAPDVSATDASASKSSATAPKLLTLTYDKSRKPVPGTDVVATAEGLPANRKVTLLWGTVDGGWVIEGYSHFRGKKFSDATKPLTDADVDADMLKIRQQFPTEEAYKQALLLQGVTVEQLQDVTRRGTFWAYGYASYNQSSICDESRQLTHKYGNPAPTPLPNGSGCAGSPGRAPGDRRPGCRESGTPSP
jgi:hypothetical protein